MYLRIGDRIINTDNIVEARVSYARVLYVTRQARKRCEGAHAATNAAEMVAELFFEELSGGTTRLHKSPPRAYSKLVEALKDLRNVLANVPNEEANLLQGMVGRLRTDLESFYGTPDDDYAYAVVAGRGGGRSANAKTYPELKSWLVETADVFRDEVLPHFDEGGVVLTSATLASSAGKNRSFDYTRKRLGLEEVLETATDSHKTGGADGEEADEVSRPVSEFAGAEVFDYGSRVLIYAESGANGPSGMPAPTFGNADAFTQGCVRRTEELVRLSRGRALIILSTKRAVSAFRETFQTPYPVRYQGDDAPGRLVKWLRETDGGVLVGTASFREGIDVAGEALSLVVMDKAPFAPPDDPVTSKLREKAGDAAFRDIFLPKAQVAMRQGAGRLMRRPDDRGVIAILDPRISAKGWGKSILSSLPPAPRTTEIADVACFFGVR